MLNRIRAKAQRWAEIQPRRAGEVRGIRQGKIRTNRLYLTDRTVDSRFAPRLNRDIPGDARMYAADAAAFCEPYDLISFDVFDTLLCRYTGRPEEVFRILEEQNGIPEFAKARRAAEAKAREGGREATLAGIYAVMAREGIVPSAQDAARAELEAERAVLYANPWMLEIVKELKGRGKRLIVISDMYLSAAQIAELLREKGYPEFDGVYVSCEAGCGKAGGTLYRKTLERTGGKRILHFGDNPEADGDCAAAAGIDQALLVRPMDYPGERNRIRGPYLGDILADGLRRRRKYQEAREPAWLAGYTAGGPLAVGFCQWIRRKAEERGWEKLLFSARDGWTAWRIYTKYFGEAEYIPISRAAAQMLDMERQPQAYWENNIAGRIGSGETVGELTDRLGLRKTAEGWARDGLRRDEALDGKTGEKIRELILRDRNLIAEDFREARENALRYFSELLGDSRTAAVIDTGWKGSAGLTLGSFLRERGREIRIETALMGTFWGNATAGREERGELHGWLYGTAHDLDRKARMFEGGHALACSLVEMLFMTDQPQLVSYAGEGFTFGEKPGREDQALAAALQAGAMAFAEDWFALAERLGLRPEISAEGAFRCFEDFLMDRETVLRVFGGHIHHAAPVGESRETFFWEEMQKAGWIR